ncbi:DUF397 domain-containing protein [Kitasatospora sp. NPDC006697]|uniref:DUF397 domain-containing protein n=1 Tax=Kitasatospora sp. NPDC006697 TaxID=3364020 RepID=UPI0036B6E176
MNAPKADLYAYDLSDAVWRKSSASAGEGECFEVTELPGGGRAVRDSKNPHLPALRFNAAEWAAAQQGFLNGEL